MKEGVKLIINKWGLIIWSSGVLVLESDYFENAKCNFCI